MPAKQLAIASCEYIRRRRRGPQHIAKPVHRPALQINASEQRSDHALPAIAQQSPRLFHALNVPREKNHPSRLQPLEQGTDLRRNLCAIKTNDQQLSNLVDTPSLALIRHFQEEISSVPLWDPYR
jgi:hypothetical protein